MNPRSRETGKALLALALVAAGLAALVAFLFAGGRWERDRLSGRIAVLETDLSALAAKEAALFDEHSRTRLELAEAREAGRQATDALAEARSEADSLRAELERVRAERDDHLAARIDLGRRLDDALDLLASRGE